MKTIGQKLSPILEEIEHTLWEFEANVGNQPEYTIEGFRAAVKIFSSALMDKMYNLQVNEDISFDDRLKMAQTLGEDIRGLVKTYADIDMHEFYKK